MKPYSKLLWVRQWVPRFILLALNEMLKNNRCENLATDSIV